MKKILKRVILTLVVILLLLMILPYAIPVAQYADSITGPYENSRMVNLDDTMIHTRHWSPVGKAKANILLVHGFCGSTYNWESTVPALTEAGYRVLAIDIPPFGYSDRFPEAGHGLAARNAYAWGAIDAATGEHSDEDNSKWWLVGHSMGGGIIEAMAQIKPERTAGLIFVDGGGFSSRGDDSKSIQQSVARMVMGFGPVRRWGEVIATHFIFQDDRIRDLCISAAGAPPSEEILNTYLATLRVPQTASAILDMFRSDREALALDAGTITQPTLIVWGDEDTWVPLSRGEALHKQIKHSEWFVIEGMHHMPMETHVEAFNGAVVRFLDKHSGNQGKIQVVLPGDTE